MGVPVVTLAGQSAFARNAVGPLMETGLNVFIADSHRDYVRRASAAVTATTRLRDIRRGLRARLMESPLLDRLLFVRRMEDAYRDVWRSYCARHQPQ